MERIERWARAVYTIRADMLGYLKPYATSNSAGSDALIRSQRVGASHVFTLKTCAVQSRRYRSDALHDPRYTIRARELDGLAGR